MVGFNGITLALLGFNRIFVGHLIVILRGVVGGNMSIVTCLNVVLIDFHV